MFSFTGNTLYLGQGWYVPNVTLKLQCFVHSISRHCQMQDRNVVKQLIVQGDISGKLPVLHTHGINWT